jgi:hypothetical protein
MLQREAGNQIASQGDCSHLVKFVITSSLLDFCLTSSSTFFLYGIYDLAKTMVDIKNDHSDAAAQPSQS